MISLSGDGGGSAKNELIDELGLAGQEELAASSRLDNDGSNGGVGEVEDKRGTEVQRVSDRMRDLSKASAPKDAGIGRSPHPCPVGSSLWRTATG